MSILPSAWGSARPLVVSLNLAVSQIRESGRVSELRFPVPGSSTGEDATWVLCLVSPPAGSHEEAARLVDACATAIPFGGHYTERRFLGMYTRANPTEFKAERCNK